jgi:hypothetical protein
MGKQQPLRGIMNTGGAVPASIRSIVLSHIESHNRAGVRAGGARWFYKEFARLAPDRTRCAAEAILYNLRNNPEYRYGNATLRLLRRFARELRARAEQLPLQADDRPKQRIKPIADVAPVAKVAPPITADRNLVDASALARALLDEFDRRGRAAPANSEPAVPALTCGQAATSVKQFHEMSETAQLSILNSMMSRYARSLESNGMNGSSYAAAWNVSYDAYERATGDRVRDRASREWDGEGKRVQAIEIIRRDGALVRFWEIVRDLWER